MSQISGLDFSLHYVKTSVGKNSPNCLYHNGNALWSKRIEINVSELSVKPIFSL